MSAKLISETPDMPHRELGFEEVESLLRGPPEERVVVRRVLPDREILAAMNGLGAILAVRLMLALAVCGAFVLAYTAMPKPDSMALWMLGIYGVVVIAPLAWLSTKRV